ncbi:hypothetical protein EEJ34_18325 [Vibrio cholerae]|nr:hypothetical protein EEJ34_18325 [Vibrio cholerae]
MIPSWKQYNKWSLPSKVTYISFIIGVVSLLFGLITYYHATENGLYKLSKITNTRFGFSVLYPESWVRNDSDNADGYTFIDPADQNVRISVYGSHISTFLDLDDAKLYGDDVIAYRDWLMSIYEEEKYYVASSLENGSIVQSYNKKNEIINERLKGWLIELIGSENDNKIYIYHKISAYKGVGYSVYATVPFEKLPIYKPLLDRMSSSLIVLEFDERYNDKYDPWFGLEYQSKN